MVEVRTMGRTSSSKLLAALLIVVGTASAEIVAADPEQEAGPPQTAFIGGSLFRTYCASCHGTSAKGDGPLADSLRKAPPDLTQFTKKNRGTFPAEMVKKIIDGRDPVRGHGGGDMPVWGDAFARSRDDSDPESVAHKIQELVDYLESIQERPAEVQ
jgi:mono/diheme cytochrome c family protein